MKILFLTRKFYPSIGGVEKHSLEVGKRLLKIGNELTVITEAEERQKEANVVEGIKVFRIPITLNERLKKFQIWFWLLKNLRLIKKSEIIHCHDVFFWYLPFRFLFPFKKVFITFHGWEGVYPPRLKSKLIRKISEKLSRGNICVGKYIEKWYGTKADFVIYGGVEKIGFHKLNFDRFKTIILFIGRLERDTGLPIYLDVIKKMREAGIKFSVSFLGEGSFKHEAEKYGKVLGFLKETGSCINKAEFIFTSGYLSMLEAMVKRRLVFSVYDNPLKKDYLEMSPFNGKVKIEGNHYRLLKKILYYISCPKKENEMAKKGCEWASRQTWEKVVEVYLKLWQK